MYLGFWWWDLLQSVGLTRAMRTPRDPLVVLLGLVTAACVGALPAPTPRLSGDASGGTETVRVTNEEAPGSAPSAGSSFAVDSRVEPISLANPPAAAATAFEICRVGDWVARYGPEVISGAGRIDRARDAVRYVPLTGREPEIQTDDPAWIIQFRGEIRVDWSLVFTDPVCIVVDGTGGFHGTGPVRVVGTDAVITPQPVAFLPDLALPPPLP
jgi:hypothetical protein